MQIQKQNQKAITLIALVVTIIILLILAGIAITAITGENGLLTRTKQAITQTRYTSTKEKINIELMQIQADCAAQEKEYNIKEIAIGMQNSTEITIEKCFYKEVASVKEGIEVDRTNLKAIAVSVDEYSEYKFLIEENCSIGGVLEGEITETTAKTEFSKTEQFEKKIFGKAIIQENTKITYTTVPETYTNQDSIKLSLKISNEKGIKTIEFPDGESVECYGRTEYSKDYPTMVNGTYTYKVTDMQGNEETKEIIIDLIDKLKPKDFTPTIKKEGSKITITPNGDDAEADETSSKSGIAYYEYYLIDESSKETKYETNVIENLALGTYQVYVIAYDKAENSKKSNILELNIILQLEKLETKNNTSYGIDKKGNIWSWGSNTHGQVGNGDTVNQKKPVQITTETVFKQIDASYDCHVTALDSQGNIWTWGRNNYGQVGNDSTENQLTPVQITTGTIFKQISLGVYHSLALDNSGNIWAWGRNNYGQVGNGTTANQLTPVKITDGTIFTQILTRRNHNIALDNRGNVWAWGGNGSGQVGDGTRTDQLTPVKITTGTIFKQISIGNNHSLAIDTSGNIWSWGKNVSGQIGDDSTKYQLTPIQITKDITFNQIVTREDSNLALDNDGNIWSWGYNSNGEVGNGKTTNQLTPVQITTETVFKQISLGERHVLALDNSGNIWAWGGNDFGQVGNGKNINQLIPVKITNGIEIKQLIVGSHHNFAIDNNQNIWGWGWNQSYQLGITGGIINVPTLIK